MIRRPPKSTPPDTLFPCPTRFRSRLDFLTSLGRPHGRRGGAGVTYVVTDLGVLEPDAESGELTMTALYTDVTPDEARRSEEHPSELQSTMRNSYAFFCLKNKLQQSITIQYTR